MFKQFLKKTKDTAISTVALPFINNAIKDYGEAKDLRVDSLNKKVEIDILLKGESEIIEVILNSYEVVKSDDGNYITIGEVSVSMEWLDKLVNNIVLPQVLPEKKLRVPDEYSLLLQIL